jgi:hypothetical protein
MAKKRHRYHVVQEFNKGVYDYIIATDEGGSKQDDEEDSGTETLQLEEEDCTLRKSSCAYPVLSAHFR